MKFLNLHPQQSGATKQNSQGSTDRSRKSRRGQSTVELALVLPLIIILLSIVIEAGLALNAWMRVNTAARDATRFAIDSGRPADTASLVLNKLQGMDSSKVDIYIITGTTDGNGNIPFDNAHWNVNHKWGSRSGGTNVTNTTIQQKLVSSSDPSANKNMPFMVVEVDFQYSPLLTSLIARNTFLPMTSYAIIQQY